MKGVEFSLDAVIKNTRTIKNQTGNEINVWLWRVIKTHKHGLFDAWVKSPGDLGKNPVVYTIMFGCGG